MHVHVHKKHMYMYMRKYIYKYMRIHERIHLQCTCTWENTCTCTWENTFTNCTCTWENTNTALDKCCYQMYTFQPQVLSWFCKIWQSNRNVHCIWLEDRKITNNQLDKYTCSVRLRFTEKMKVHVDVGACNYHGQYI